MAHPAAQRLAQILLMPAGDIEISRCARPAIQMFVTTADREIDAIAIEKQFDRARAVAQIPEHERSCLMRRVGNRAHVMQSPVCNEYG